MMTLSVPASTLTPAAPPRFREKNAVCIEARAAQTTATIKPVQPRACQYQLADMQIAAQLLRDQSGAPAACAHDVAYAYQHNGVTVTAGIHGMQV